MKATEIRERSDAELVELENELRDQLIRLSVAKATQRIGNTAQLSRIRRDIARVKTVARERQLGFEGGRRPEASSEEVNS
ncbi:MAG: 50S ribosomal protein L29 [Myxococcales bacterium]|nr:50S ribosomal protein L29 [Myxococcales bacterium]